MMDELILDLANSCRRCSAVIRPYPKEQPSAFKRRVYCQNCVAEFKQRSAQAPRTCQRCGNLFHIRPREPRKFFNIRKFCGQECQYAWRREHPERYNKTKKQEDEIDVMSISNEDLISCVYAGRRYDEPGMEIKEKQK